MSKPNPLQGFFRKAKFNFTLPSRGKWYSLNGLDATDGVVDVYAMTAADDTRFKTNEILISHLATYDLLKSCIPQIKDPETMPIVDLDAALLSIRRASYGEQMNFTVPVPNTQLTHTTVLNIKELVDSLANAREIWDDQLIIKDGDLSLTLKLAPVTLKSMFGTTRQLMKQQQNAEKLSNSSQDTDEKIDELDSQMKSLGNISVGLVIDSIKSLETSEGYSTDKPNEIRQFITQIDLEYFRAIQQHLEQQKDKISFPKIVCEATPDMIAAGAPASWEANVVFSLTDFFSK